MVSRIKVVDPRPVKSGVNFGWRSGERINGALFGQCLLKGLGWNIALLQDFGLILAFSLLIRLELLIWTFDCASSCEINVRAFRLIIDGYGAIAALRSRREG